MEAGFRTLSDRSFYWKRGESGWREIRENMENRVEERRMIAKFSLEFHKFNGNDESEIYDSFRDHELPLRDRDTPRW